jgi:hypothetical protein
MKIETEHCRIVLVRAPITDPSPSSSCIAVDLGPLLLRQNRPGRRDTSNTKHHGDEGFPKVHTQLILEGAWSKTELGVK